jgi:hypothetical protein
MGSDTGWSKSEVLQCVQTVFAFFMLATLVLGLFTYKASRNQQRFEILERFHEEWNSPRFIRIQELFGPPGHVPVDSLAGDRAVLCNFFEKVGVYVEQGIISDQDVHKFFGEWPCKYWDKVYKGVNDYRRAQGAPQSWVHFEGLCERLKRFE